MLPPKFFKDYAKAFTDLNSLRVELTHLVESQTARAHQSKYADEKKNEDFYTHREESAITDLLGEEKESLIVVDLETEALQAASEADVALTQPDVDFYQLDLTDPEMAEDAYPQLLIASKVILRTAIRQFYRCDENFFENNISLLERACSHFGVIQGGNAAGMLLQEQMYNKAFHAEMISLYLIENNANVNWHPVLPVMDENGVPAATHEFHSSTLSRAIRYNQDDKLLDILLEHNAKDDENHNALFYFLSVDKLSLAAKLLKQDINNLDEVRAKFVAGENAPAIHDSKIHLKFIRALETLEDAAFTTDDKKFLLSHLNAEIAEAKTIDDCLKIYADNMSSPCLNYQRIVTNIFSSEGFTTTRVEFMKAVQLKLVELLRILWLTNDPSTLNEINKLRAHDIFTPLHCSYTEKQNYRAVMMDMLEGKQSIVFITDSSTSQMVLTDEMHANHFLHPNNNMHVYAPDAPEPVGVLASITSYFSFFSASQPAPEPYIPAQPLTAETGTELQDMSASDRSDYEAERKDDSDIDGPRDKRSLSL